MLSGIKSLSQKHHSSVVLWPACLRCPFFLQRIFTSWFPLPTCSDQMKQKKKKTKSGCDLLCRCRLLWFNRSIYLINPFYVSLGNKSICDQIGITTIIYINTNEMLHTTPQTPHGHTLISHTFSTHFYWLCLRPHIKTHQSSQQTDESLSKNSCISHVV